MARKVLLSAILICSFMSMPGCIVQEIRDELKSANTQLAGVQEKLDQLETTNTTLAATNVELATTNDLIQIVHGGLTKIDTGLNRIDSTNDSLNTLENQLTTLASMNKSMIRLDGHLSSLRATITKLDSSLPFFDLGGDGEPIDAPSAQLPPDSAQSTAMQAQVSEPVTDPAAAPATAATSGDATTHPTTNSPATSTRTSTSKPDSMSGTWLSAYPDRGAALIILPTNKYHLGKPQNFEIKILGNVGQDNPGSIETGTWKREQNTLIFTPDAYTVNSKDEASQTVTPTPWKLTVLSQLGRSATTQIEEILVVWTRP